ncbi:TylF/MycF family methyltransferase [Nocardioides sp. SYSU DS0651]|uniref:TylF/MycF family methyltransferase n=1 Tax=Nocardioides sp. SYSU DS0651 TaxID=3415955 RepID=UPI003F4B3F08
MTTTEGELRELYLDLMKRVLTGALMEDNDSILGGVRTQGSPSRKKQLANAVGTAAQRFGFEIAYKKPYDAEQRAHGNDWPSRAESMIGLKRMQNIQDCITQIMEQDVPGDFIETGVWRGGACIFMRANLKAWGDTSRTVWLADSFEGLPAPNVKDFPADAGDTFYKQSGLSVGEAAVRHNFERYNLLDDQVKFLVGWFKDTLPTAPVDKLALLRLDGDLYESTWQAIEALYPKLSPGGFCIVDDYGTLPTQAQAAVHDYRKQHGITDEIVDIDGNGAFWRKS